MDSAVVLALITLLAAHVGNAAASCREVQNDDMLEYLCEGGHPGDLATVLETTEKLRINRMPLRRITADTFAKFGSNLWVLSCSHCEISDIETDAFRRLVNLQQLNLDNNYLTSVKASWFEGLDSLTYLDVNYNDIRDIEDGVYQNLPALVDFRISGNRLRCLNLDGMSRLRQLKRMFLSENPDFVCPHAVSEFLENQHVTFERDPEWRRLDHDAIEVHVPPARAEEEEKQGETRDEISVPADHERPQPERRPPHPPEAPAVPPLTGDRTFHPAEHYGRRRRPMTTTTTTTTTMRPIVQQSHVPRVEPIPPAGMRTSYQSPPEQGQSSRPIVFYPYPIPETPREPLLESRPPLEDARMTAEADRPPLTEDGPIHPSHVPIHETTSSYPSYVTSERSREPPMESRPSPEDIKLMAGTYRTPSTGHISTYPMYIPTHETTSAYPSYTTSKDSRVSWAESRPPSEDTTGSTVKPDRPMLTEHTLTYPPYDSTHKTMSYPYPYATSERTLLPVVESEEPAEKDMTTWFNESPHAVENTVTYPLYAATPDGLERIPKGSIQMRPRPTSDSGAFVTSRTWSTDDSMERHPDVSSQDAEHHQKRPSSWLTTVTTTETPYYMSRGSLGRDYEVVVENLGSSSIDDLFITTDQPNERGEAERSRTTIMTSSDDEDADKENVHYVGPGPASPPETVYPISTNDELYAPYYESTVTMHPPLLHDGGNENNQEPTTVIDTTTDKPLPDCPKKNSAPRVRPASVLMMSIVTIFGYVFVTVF